MRGALKGIRRLLEAEAREMQLAHLEIRVEVGKLDGRPAEMTPSDSGGALVWVTFDPLEYARLDARGREFLRRHELAHGYFGALGRVHERVIKELRNRGAKELADEFERELIEAEEDVCDLLARAFTRAK